jgi:hypothetical protein
MAPVTASPQYHLQDSQISFTPALPDHRTEAFPCQLAFHCCQLRFARKGAFQAKTWRFSLASTMPSGSRLTSRDSEARSMVFAEK